MTNDIETAETSAAGQKPELQSEIAAKTLSDYSALALATCGVGYLPLAPGTWGSVVGVAIYLLVWQIETNLGIYFLHKSWNAAQITAWIYAANAVIFTGFCLIGFGASSRAAKLFQKKDPQKVVVDEVMGQLLTFMFIPFGVHWYYVIAGFLLFRLFDIWKPHPVRNLETLPQGLGICADDLLAGIYAGTCLALLYAVLQSIL